MKIDNLYKASLTEQVKDLVTWDEFSSFIQLYKEGISAVRNGDTSSFAAGAPFQDALKSNHPFLQRLSSEKRALFWELLRFDSLPLYLKDHICHHEVIEHVYEMARNAKVDPEALFRLVQAVHLVQVKQSEPKERISGLFARIWSCLTSIVYYFKKPVIQLDRKDLDKVATVTECLAQATIGEQFFHSCLRDIAKKKNPSDLKEVLFKMEVPLWHYVEKVHKEMLAAGEDQPLYRAIKRGFRDIFVYCDVPNRYGRLPLAVKAFRTDYLCRFSMPKVKKFIETEKARLEQKTREQSKLGEKILGECAEMIKKKSQAHAALKHYIDNLESVNTFIQECHRQLLRNEGSFTKVKNTLEKVLKVLMLQPRQSFKRIDLYSEQFIKDCKKRPDKVDKEFIEKIDVDEDLLALFPYTFLHGSNGSVFSNLSLTSMHLAPSGRLAKEGIVPFSGELSVGTLATGINTFSLSGTSLPNGELAIYYSEAGFYTDKDTEDTKVGDFIQKYSNPKQPLFEFTCDAIDAALHMIRATTAILRLRTLFPDLYEKHASSLKQIVVNIGIEWEKFKQSSYYRKSIPYDERHYKEAEGAIQRLKNAMTCEINQKVYEPLLKPFPVVFGSKTLHARPHPSAERESNTQKAALLGRDIQTIFVDKEVQAEMASYLQKHGLEVAVADREQLRKAIKLSQYALPYFDSIQSKKRPTFRY